MVHSAGLLFCFTFVIRWLVREKRSSVSALTG